MLFYFEEVQVSKEIALIQPYFLHSICRLGHWLTVLM